MSGIYERYAFDSHFTVDMNDLDVAEVTSEAVLYKMFLPRWNEKQRAVWLPIAYAFVANTASFFVGLQVAKLIPEFV